MQVSIIGATGYGGIELIRLLSDHPNVTIHSIYSSSQEGMEISSIYPHVSSLVSLELELIDIDQMVEEVDLVFLSTPTGVSSELVPTLLEKGVRIIDLSGDFRIQNGKAFQQFYGMPAGPETVRQHAVYGLTEWMRTKKETRLIANPGCFPTVALLGLAPLVKEEVVDPTSIIIDAKTGVSGAGRSASASTHYPTANDSMSVYKVNVHQHIPEIEEQLMNWNDSVEPITFTTHLAPMTRGIMATMYLAAQEETSTTELYDLYTRVYADDPFIRIRPLGTFPSTKEVQGSNYCDIGISYDERTKRITVVSVIDNLVKGASGQAVQNMNVLFGFPEGAGLTHVPLYP